MDVRTAAAQKWPDLEIGECLGHGSGGRVYKVFRHQEGRVKEYALKHVLIPENDLEISGMCREGMTIEEVTDYYEKTVQKCLGEISIMYALENKDHIVGIEDDYVCRDPEKVKWHILILMEYLTPVMNYLDTGEADERFVRELGSDICRALTECEKKGILHRDIKPDNIFITQDRHFKLGDFGISRLLPKDPSVLSLKGTPAYLAPEVSHGEAYSCQADQYSLGIVLYTLLNRGRLPLLDQNKVLLTADETGAAIQRRLGGEVLPPPAGASKEMGEVILKACRFDPGERFKNAEEFRKALENPRVYVDRAQKMSIKRGSGPWRPAFILSAVLSVLMGVAVLTGGIPGTKTESSGEGMDDTIVWTSKDLAEEACASCFLPPGSSVTRQEAADIEIIYLSGRELGDISDLRWMAGLRELHLIDCSAGDLRPIADLKNLEILSLSGTNAEDLSFLTGCTKLSYLDISKTGIRDYSFLSEMRGLTGLSLADNTFEDGKLPALPPDLEYLDLSGTDLKDISSLSDSDRLLAIHAGDMPLNKQAEIKKIVPSVSFVKETERTNWGSLP